MPKAKAELPLVVVVTGPPGSGKTTLAEPLAAELGLPLVGRDELKEVLYDELGDGDVEWSRRLGRATFALIYVVAARLVKAGSGVVLEANFFKGLSENGFARLPPHRVVQVHCSVSDEVVLARYAARTGRHPGHVDHERADEVSRRLRAGDHEPLDLPGTVLHVDTNEPVDITGLAAQIRAVAD